jgi:hypothetical protein
MQFDFAIQRAGLGGVVAEAAYGGLRSQPWLEPRQRAKFDESAFHIGQSRTEMLEATIQTASPTRVPSALSISAALVS